MHFDVMLDANDPDFIANLRNALGLEEGESLTITAPQFDRSDGRVVTYFPRSEMEFSALAKMSAENLKKLGLGMWDGDASFTHWLYPAEWYWCIPAGHMVTTISGEEEQFIPGKADNDKRFGCLAYGFIQKHGASHE